MDRWPYKEKPRAWAPDRGLEAATLAAVPVKAAVKALDREAYLDALADRVAWMMRQHLGPGLNPNRRLRDLRLMVEEAAQDDLGNLHQAQTVQHLAEMVVNSLPVLSALDRAGALVPVRELKDDPEAVSAVQETGLEGWVAQLRPAHDLL